MNNEQKSIHNPTKKECSHSLSHRDHSCITSLNFFFCCCWTRNGKGGTVTQANQRNRSIKTMCNASKTSSQIPIDLRPAAEQSIENTRHSSCAVSRSFI